MTPAEVETAARRKVNAVNSSFWSQLEIMDYIFQACLEMAREALVIENTYTTTSVSAQQEYAQPTNTIGIKRITYNGQKVEPITFRQADEMSLSNAVVTAAGTPSGYVIFDETIYFYPTPSDSTSTIKILAYVEPQAVTSTSVLEIPTQFHMDLVDKVVSEMYAKDENFDMAQWFDGKWEKAKLRAKNWKAKQKRGDSFASVHDEGN